MLEQKLKKAGVKVQTYVADNITSFIASTCCLS